MFPAKLDKYIIKKFMATFFIAILLIIGIVIIFDISEKIDDFVAKQAPIKAIVLDYKFGAPNPKYHRQVREYMEVMRLLGYREVEGYLWYAQQAELECVNG